MTQIRQNAGLVLAFCPDLSAFTCKIRGSMDVCDRPGSASDAWQQAGFGEVINGEIGAAEAALVIPRAIVANVLATVGAQHADGLAVIVPGEAGFAFRA